MHHNCEDVRKLMDEYETNIMVRAQKEGLDPLDVKAVYHMVTADNPIQVAVVCLERMGYSTVERGRPNLCAGTPCLKEGSEYVQMWNEEKDAMFVIESRVERNIALANAGGMPALLVMEEHGYGVYYVGPEKNLDSMGVRHRAHECPAHEEGCDQYMKIYEVFDVKEAVLGRFSEKQMTRTREIMEEEFGKIKEKKVAICEAKCGKDR